jgi:NADPH:quinone reductase-like Zn-dependent oxidoreductase
MRAMIYKKYGGPEVLQLTELEKPVPGHKELLIKVEAATVSPGVIWMRKGKYPGSLFFTVLIRLMYGITKPRQRVLGAEFAGTVQQVGTKVKLFKPGDKVYGTTSGLNAGSYAEYIVMPENRRQGVIAIKPPQLSMPEAAALPIGGMTAIHLLSKAQIGTGQKILIYGASGSVGTSAVQIAKYACAKVTAVCSTTNTELLKAVGADHVIDYTREDIRQLKERFDIVLDAVGKLPRSAARLLLKEGGRFSTVRSVTEEKTDYLRLLQQMIEQGEFHPVIDRVYPLDRMVEAQQYVEKGHKKGNVIITI